MCVWGGGGRHMAKRNSDPRVAYPEVKHQVRDMVRVAGIVAPFAPVGPFTRRKFVLSSPREKMGTGELCRMPPVAVCHRRARQTSGTRRIIEGSCGIGPAGSVFGENSFI